MSSLGHTFPSERNRGFLDADGVLTFAKLSDEIMTLPLDWSGLLASGVTISSVAYEDSGVTTSSRTNTTTTTTCLVTGLGSTKITATLSNGAKLIRQVRFVEPTGANVEDYD